MFLFMTTSDVVVVVVGGEQRRDGLFIVQFILQ